MCGMDGWMGAMMSVEAYRRDEEGLCAHKTIMKLPHYLSHLGLLSSVQYNTFIISIESTTRSRFQPRVHPSHHIKANYRHALCVTPVSHHRRRAFRAASSQLHRPYMAISKWLELAQNGPEPLSCQLAWLGSILARFGSGATWS